MTIFDETNLDRLAADHAAHQYAQVYAQQELKALFHRDQLRPSHWHQAQALIGDRRWIHALKLGLLTEDEFYHGEQGPDVEVIPNEVILEPQVETLIPDPTIEQDVSDDIAAEDDNGVTMPLTAEPDEIATIPTLSPETETTDSEEESVIEEVERPAIVSSDSLLFETGSTEVESDETINLVDEADDEQVSDDTDEEDEVEEDAEQPIDLDNAEEGSSFVSWLRNLPVKGSYTSLQKATDEDKVVVNADETQSAQSEEEDEKPSKAKKKKAKKEKKKEKLKAKKKAKKKKQKKDKRKQGDEAMPFQGRLEGSLLLSDTIASETLAELLRDHGHKGLARKMYKQLSMNNPEKSRYFAAQIEQIKEEE